MILIYFHFRVAVSFFCLNKNFNVRKFIYFIRSHYTIQKFKIQITNFYNLNKITVYNDGNMTVFACNVAHFWLVNLLYNKKKPRKFGRLFNSNLHLNYHNHFGIKLMLAPLTLTSHETRRPLVTGPKEGLKGSKFIESKAEQIHANLTQWSYICSMIWIMHPNQVSLSLR